MKYLKNFEFEEKVGDWDIEDSSNWISGDKVIYMARDNQWLSNGEWCRILSIDKTGVIGEDRLWFSKRGSAIGYFKSKYFLSEQGYEEHKKKMNMKRFDL